MVTLTYPIVVQYNSPDVLLLVFPPLVTAQTGHQIQQDPTPEQVDCGMLGRVHGIQHVGYHVKRDGTCLVGH